MLSILVQYVPSYSETVLCARDLVNGPRGSVVLSVASTGQG